jgi:AcrR family transcriptional regulator
LVRFRHARYHKRTVVRESPYPTVALGEHQYACPMPNPPGLLELPVIAAQRSERADAARNRSALLNAAERLMGERGADAITMDAVACAAGVGKGTLFRRFGDRAGLFHALLDESERRLQEGFIRGPAPLGPGSPPAERLIAFGHALLELTHARGDLLLAAEPSARGQRYHGAVYAAYRAHLTALLAEIVSREEAQYLADVLLGALAPDLVLHQYRVLGMSVAQLKDAWQQLVLRIAHCPSPNRPAQGI